MFFKHYWIIAKKTFYAWSADGISHISASLAYYTIFSIAPLLVICISLTSFLFSNDVVEQHILEQIRNMLGSGSANQIKYMIAGASKPSTGIISSLIGVIVLLLAAGGFFGELQSGLNVIWGVKPKSNQGILGVIKSRFLSITMVLGVAFLLLVSLVISTLITAMSSYINNLIPGATIFWIFFNFLISLCIITLLFAMLFKYLPEVDLKWRDVGLGAVITAFLFTVGKLAIEIYLGKSNITSTYGAAGSLIAILVWVYYSVQILFLGAEFTKINFKMNSGKIKPSKNAVLI